tara:strand:- start:16963 stop:19284 length:2322 start_codon:yes stop_codon:yes gene_type:complete
MSLGSNNLLLGAASGASGYQIERSLMLDSAAGNYLQLSPTTNQQAASWTYSVWFKKKAGVHSDFLWAFQNFSTNVSYITISNTNQLKIYNEVGNVIRCQYQANLEFYVVDSSAWYNLVVAVDGPNDTLEAWLNGKSVTWDTSTGPGNYNWLFGNATYPSEIGLYNATARSDFYMAELYYLKGEVLDATDFGAYDNNNVWQPKEFTGTIPTDDISGYWNFSDNTSITTLGADSSDNGNNWVLWGGMTVANSYIDTPTDIPGSDSGVGGEVHGNYCVLSPLDKRDLGYLAGGMLIARTDTGNGVVNGTISVTSGKWYWEVTKKPTQVSQLYGIWQTDTSTPGVTPGGSTFTGNTTNSWGYYDSNGYLYNNGSGSAYGATFAANDVIGVALNLDDGELEFYKNGVSQGVAVTGLSGRFVPSFTVGTASTHSGSEINFGQKAFVHTAPAGYKCLVSTNLPTPALPDPTEAFDAVLDTGANINATAQAALGGKTDIFWIKDRFNANQHQINDFFKGTSFDRVYTSPTAQANIAYGAPTGNSIAYCWDAGAANTTNDDGDTSVTIRANPAAGISILTWTGDGTATTVGHGLNAAPEMIWAKIDSASNFIIWHRAYAATGAFFFNTKGSTASAAYWNNQAPTDSVVHVGTGINVAAGATLYCFTGIPGFSEFGCYEGNHTAGRQPYVNTGFLPNFVLTKDIDSASYSWMITDNTQNTNNYHHAYFLPDTTAAANTTNYYDLDLLANGFRARNANNISNTNGNTLMYAAFADHPFKSARGN